MVNRLYQCKTIQKSSIIRYINFVTSKGGHKMNKIKIRLGVIIVLVSIIAPSIFPINRDIEDTSPKNTRKQTGSEIEESKDLMEENKDEEILDNGGIDEEVDDEVIEIETLEEEIEDIKGINSEQQEERNKQTSNRSGKLKEDKVIIENKDNNLNKYVLDVIKTYSLEEGKYPYLLNDDYKNYNGVTEDLYYKGELLLKANPNGNKASHCTGITFEVFFKAMENRNKALGIPQDDFNGMTKDELMDFVLTWYVAKGPKSESNLSVAIEKYGLGTKIRNLEDLRPGDFIDLSRENNTGHTVIFQNWIREGNRIIGLRHWSSQESTNGINYKEEYFNIKDKNGRKYGNVIIDQLHMARIGSVNKYKGY